MVTNTVWYFHVIVDGKTIDTHYADTSKDANKKRKRVQEDISITHPAATVTFPRSKYVDSKAGK
jgi:hypothetical protein